MENLDYYLLDIQTNYYMGPDADNTYISEQFQPSTFQFQQNKDGTYSITQGNYYTFVDTTNYAWNLTSDSTKQTFFNLAITGNVISKITLASDNTVFLTLVGNGNYTPYFSNMGEPVMLRFLPILPETNVWLLTSKPLSSKLAVDYHSTKCSGDETAWDCFKEKKNASGCVQYDCNPNDIPLGKELCPLFMMEYKPEKKNNYYLYGIIAIIVILILFIIFNK